MALITKKNVQYDFTLQNIVLSVLCNIPSSLLFGQTLQMFASQPFLHSA